MSSIDGSGQEAKMELARLYIADCKQRHANWKTAVSTDSIMAYLQRAADEDDEEDIQNMRDVAEGVSILLTQHVRKKALLEMACAEEVMYRMKARLLTMVSVLARTSQLAAIHTLRSCFELQYLESAVQDAMCSGKALNIPNAAARALREAPADIRDINKSNPGMVQDVVPKYVLRQTGCC